jgi:hypothetical protein
VLARVSSGQFATLALSYVGGGYALGTWLGKVIALIAGRDRSLYGDIGGVICGLLGMLLFAVDLGGKLGS